jgi:hypothetical protein
MSPSRKKICPYISKLSNTRAQLKTTIKKSHELSSLFLSRFGELILLNLKYCKCLIVLKYSKRGFVKMGILLGNGYKEIRVCVKYVKDSGEFRFVFKTLY